MKVTPAKIEANRKNSLKSTDPKTPQGKAVVRYNALKHGILAREAVITEGDGREERESFDNLLSGLHDELKPQGVLEEMLTEKIAVSYWRFGRLLRAETGGIRIDLDSARRNESARRVDGFKREKELAATFKSPNAGFRRSSLGLDYMIDALEDAGIDVKREGGLTEKTWKELKRHFSVEPAPIEEPDGGAERNDFMYRLAAASGAGENGKPNAKRVPKLLRILEEEKNAFSPTGNPPKRPSASRPTPKWQPWPSPPRRRPAGWRYTRNALSGSFTRPCAGSSGCKGSGREPSFPSPQLR